MLQCGACEGAQRVAVWCSVLQCVAVFCLQGDMPCTCSLRCVAVYLQCVAALPARGHATCMQLQGQPSADT